MTSVFTKPRIRLTVMLLMGTALPLVCHGWPIGEIHQNAVSVAGTVSDPSGAVIVNAKVLVRSSSFERETATNQEGKYEIELPPGILSIEVRSPGFCRAHRPSFNARAQMQVKFDFTLLVCPSHGEGPMSYESFTLKSGSSTPPAFLIRFGKRTDRQDTIEFEGAVTEIAYYDSDTKLTDRHKNQVKVAVIYDCWTISANHLTLNKRTLRMELSGDVAILDGVQESKGSRAEVDFALPRPIANVKD